MDDKADSRQAGAKVPPKPDPGFTPERDRRMIMLSCVTLLVMSLVIFLMVRKRLVELSDVTGAYAQVSFTAAETIRAEAEQVSASELVSDPASNTARWLESSGMVVIVHDKKGDQVNWDSPNAALGSVYWLDCGLPVTAVKPQAPVVREGESIRFWGQIAETEVSKLEFSEEMGPEVQQRFGLKEGDSIAIFFASEVEPAGRDTPLSEENDETAGLATDPLLEGSGPDDGSAQAGGE